MRKAKRVRAKLVRLPDEQARCANDCMDLLAHLFANVQKYDLRSLVIVTRTGDGEALLATAGVRDVGQVLFDMERIKARLLK